MAARNGSNADNNIREAMALLIRNQAAFVEQIARNDQERLQLQARSEKRQLEYEAWQRDTKAWQGDMKEWQREMKEWQRKTDEWQRKADERFARIEAQLAELPKRIVQTVLDQMPRIKKEIGFKTPR